MPIWVQIPLLYWLGSGLTAFLCGLFKDQFKSDTYNGRGLIISMWSILWPVAVLVLGPVSVYRLGSYLSDKIEED